MFRFILSFLTGFSVVYYLLKRNEKEESLTTEEDKLSFPPSPPKFEDTDKLLGILKTFNKMKNEI